MATSEHLRVLKGGDDGLGSYLGRMHQHAPNASNRECGTQLPCFGNSGLRQVTSGNVKARSL
eukprot:661791-Amphidinium_carterae.1